MTTSATCRRVAAFNREMSRVLGDGKARREWLWLRAREKEDDPTLEVLTRGDPDLPSRMRVIDDVLGSISDPRKRREAYGRLLDLRSPDVSPVSCACASCSTGVTA